jgi:biopolymer transport protein ExbD
VRAAVQLNLTPMIDVIFNLLIFFVVGTRFAEVEGLLASELPAAPAQGVQAAIPLMPIRVRLAPDPAGSDGCLIRIDNTALVPRNFLDLREVLIKLKGEHTGFESDTPIVIIADEAVQWQHVVNAFNAGKAAGYQSISFGQ